MHCLEKKVEAKSVRHTKSPKGGRSSLAMSCRVSCLDCRAGLEVVSGILGLLLGRIHCHCLMISPSHPSCIGLLLNSLTSPGSAWFDKRWPLVCSAEFFSNNSLHGPNGPNGPTRSAFLEAEMILFLSPNSLYGSMSSMSSRHWTECMYTR